MASSSSSSSSTIVHRPRQKQARAKKKVETKSTLLQEVTELECRPYFVDLASLPAPELDQLRDIGLLEREQPSQDEKEGTGTRHPNGPDVGETTFPFKVALLRSKHIEYVSQVWRQPLKSSFVSLDSSQGWMVYWCLHSCDLMSYEPPDEVKMNILDFLVGCWSDRKVTLATNHRLVVGTHHHDDASIEGGRSTTVQGGGFGGGPSQLPHAATTYAAVLALCILATGGEETSSSGAEPEDVSISTEPADVRARARGFLGRIRPPLSAWLASLQQADGSFRMHEDGEIDVRATYCAAAVASLLRLDSCIDRRSACDFVARCQTYEGGFGGEPFSEGHGGYTFCALAALVLLLDGSEKQSDDAMGVNRLRSLIDVPNLLGWLSRRQMEYEGGFQGRPNKLVDGCYSFWQGAAMALASRIASDDSQSTIDYVIDGVDFTVPTHHLLFDTAMLERYILLCAQEPKGGLRDKPSKARDYYHSCYNLSGLSIAQLSGVEYGHKTLSTVARTHPVFNIRVERVQQLRSLFYDRSL